MCIYYIQNTQILQNPVLSKPRRKYTHITQTTNTRQLIQNVQAVYMITPYLPNTRPIPTNGWRPLAAP